jgi:hypothetical protein
MHFDHGSRDRPYCIGDGNGCMGIASRIQDDPVIKKTGLMKSINDLPLNVGLEILDLGFRVMVSEFLQLGRKGF